MNKEVLETKGELAKTRKVRFVNASGLKLVIPVGTNGIVLFMEWVAANRPRCIQRVCFREDDNSFRIHIAGLIETYEEVVEYINANLIDYEEGFERIYLKTLQSGASSQ